MKRNFVFTPEADSDVLTIWEYIADVESEKAADRVIARLFNECRKLSEMPGKGHWRDELLDKRHKFWAVWSYLIVYRWESKPLQIIAIVHGSRELQTVLGERLLPR